jgi:hypothetical protein
MLYLTEKNGLHIGIIESDIHIMDYKCVHNTEYHVARITRRRKVIAEARNKIGTRSRGSGWDDQSLHAERAVVKSLGDISQLNGCTLEVIRISKHGNIKNSEPCHNCRMFLHKCMKEYGLRKVIYSSDNEDEDARTTISI